MISLVVTLIVFLLLASVLLYIARAVVALMPAPFQRFGALLYGLIALLLVLGLLYQLGWIGDGTPAWRLR